MTLLPSMLDGAKILRNSSPLCGALKLSEWLDSEIKMDKEKAHLVDAKRKILAFK
ncbi:hypothetical protein [Sphingobacterium lactis]|uniref:hypothetical protein n=1 Tax=Sphingobacterium lactis TaxID=797291 RepID=UPI001357CCBC|nr:hypothetical protein [Sphingobacterium lactis]